MSQEEPGGDESPRSASSQGGGAAGTARPGRRGPGSLVRPALLFYGAMLAVAWIIAWWTGDALFYLSPDPAAQSVRPLRDPTVGIVAGVLVILLSEQLTRRTRAGAALADALAAVLGRLSAAECVLLAVVSGLAEEVFFRGLLQPRIGLIAASLVFGLAHFVPRRDLAPWSLFAVGAGLLLGVLFESTGNLVAPVVAHATINAVNLGRLSRRSVRERS